MTTSLKALSTFLLMFVVLATLVEVARAHRYRNSGSYRNRYRFSSYASRNPSYRARLYRTRSYSSKNGVGTAYRLGYRPTLYAIGKRHSEGIVPLFVKSYQDIPGTLSYTKGYKISQPNTGNTYNTHTSLNGIPHTHLHTHSSLVGGTNTLPGVGTSAGAGAGAYLGAGTGALSSGLPGAPTTGLGALTGGAGALGNYGLNLPGTSLLTG